MAAEVRLVGISRELPDRGEPEPEPSLVVTVGKSDRLRYIPLSEADLLKLIHEAVEQLEYLHRRRRAS